MIHMELCTVFAQLNCSPVYGGSQTPNLLAKLSYFFRNNFIFFDAEKMSI